MAEQTHFAARATAPLGRAHRRRAARPAVMLVQGGLRPRPDLLRSTALQAVFLAGLAVPAGVGAAAQTMPAATALPTGGQVIAGQAKIATTTGAGTAGMTVTQATKYGAYDWKSFDIGKSASVTYQVPTSQSVSVNRVISPTSPSVIAGKLSSNGVVVVQNQSGVVFTQGAEVNVSTLIASAPGMSDANARAGRLVFDQPANPGARVENHGTITVAQTGLAALVAPQVANSGVIRAQMGRVVLAGAEAHTVDLYGDGLLSIDVTKQVTQAPMGPDGKTATALVTNSGTIIADGGTILLTASAVDGLVQNLVTAGGTMRADTAGTVAGRIAVTAQGGGVTVSGTVAARGTAAGSKGGQIEINAPARSVTVKASATVDASGRAGGGSVTVGTTMARGGGRTAVKAPTAKDVVIESGARIAADATQNGRGGDVTVLSQGGVTVHRGTLSARGGPEGGDGGFIELSGDRFVVAGKLDAGAPMGLAGNILLDPFDLIIRDTGTTATPEAGKSSFEVTTKEPATVISPAEIRANMTGAVTLKTGTGGTLSVESVFDSTAGSSSITALTLQSDGNMTIKAAVTAKDGLTLINTAGNLDITAAVSTTGNKATITLNSAGAITLGATVSAGSKGTIDFTAGAAGISQPGGTLVAGVLQGSAAGPTALNQTGNTVAALGTVTVTGGTFSLATNTALAVKGAVTGPNVELAAKDVTFDGGTIKAGAGGSFAFAPVVGALTLGGGAPAVLSGVTADNVRFGQAAGVTATGVAVTGALDLSGFAGASLIAGAGGVTMTGGTLKAGILDVTSGGGFSDSATGLLSVGTLRSTGGITGNVALNSATHAVKALDGLAATGTLALKTNEALGIVGTVKASSIALDSSAAASAVAVNVQATGQLVAAAGGTVSLTTAADSGVTLAGTVDAGATGSVALALGTKGATQTGGSIVAGTLAGASTGDVGLGQAANAVGGIGALAVSGGDVSLVTKTEVSVSGALSGKNVSITSSAASTKAIGVAAAGSIGATSGNVTLVASDAAAGGIALAGNVTAATALDLTAGAGGVTQTTGSIATPNLLSTGGSKGTVSLTNAGNAIGKIGAITVAGGNLLIANSLAGDIAGTLTVDTGQTISLALAGLTLSGKLAAPGGTVEIAPLADGASMSLGAKTVAGELLVTKSDLSNITGATLRLGGSKASATVADNLAVRADFDTAATSTTLRLDAGKSGITVNNVVLNANTLEINSAGGVSAIAGSKVSAATLQSSAGITGDVVFAGADTAIKALGTLTVTTGTLSLTTTQALTVSGVVLADGATLTSTSSDPAAITVSGKLSTNAGGALSLAATDAAGGIVLTGGVDATPTGKLSLTAGTGGVKQSAGTVAAGTLLGTSTGDMLLGEGTNRFANVGDVAATGDAKIASAVAMKVGGTVQGVTVTLDSSAGGAGALDIAGTVKTAGTATLAASGATGGITLAGTVEAATIDLSAGTGGVVQTGGGLVATTLRSAGIAGAAKLEAAGNAIGELAAFKLTEAGALSVATSTAMKVSGAVQVANGSFITLATSAAAGTLSVDAPVTAIAGGVALRATGKDGGIALSANVDAGAGGSIDLVAGSGGIAQTTGGLVAGSLGSSAPIGGPVKLVGPGNAIGGIGTVTVDAGGFSLISTGPLAVTGTLTATGATALLDVTAASGTAISVPGTIAAGAVTLIGRGTGGGISVPGAITTAGVFDISTTGGAGVTAGGVLQAGGLRSTLGIVGGFDARGANTIGTVEAVTVTGGDFAIANAAGSALKIAGAITVDAGKAIRVEADEATIGAALTAPGGSVTLLAPTSGVSVGVNTPGVLSVLQAGVDGVTAATLNLVAGGKGIVTVGGSLDATGVGTLRLDGAAGISIAGGTLKANTLELAAAGGGVVQGGGQVAAKVLTTGAGTVVGPVTLEVGTNGIASLATLAATDAVSVVTATALDITGAVSAPSISLRSGVAGTALSLAGGGSLSAAGTVSLTAANAAGGIALAGGVKAGTLELAAGGAVLQTGGQVDAGTLTAPLGVAGATLSQAGNAIPTLGIFVATNDLTLVSSQALTTTGTVSATNVSLSTTGSLTLASEVSAAGTLALGAGGGVTQTGGTVKAGTVATIGDITGAISLPLANGIASLGPLSATDAITIVSNQVLKVDGTVRAGDGRTLSLAAAGMSFGGAGALTAKGGTVEIGPVNATTTFGLGTAGGDFALATLGNVTASVLRIGQASSAGNANKAASITLADAVQPNATTLELISAGNVTQGKAGLIVPVLSADALSLTLATTGNSIKALGTVSVTNALELGTDTALAIAGTLNAASISLSSGAAGAAALDISGSLTAAKDGTIKLTAGNAAGGITLTGTVDATATGTVSLGAGSAGVVQSGGSLTTGTLRGNGGKATDVDGVLALAQGGNAIGKIGALVVTGNASVASTVAIDIAGGFTAADMLVTGTAAGATALSVSGGATASGLMTLATGGTGGIALSGTMSAATLELSAGSAGIAQSAGSITAGTLRGTATGKVGLDQATNNIAILGTFDAAGQGFNLTDGASLSVIGPVTGADIALRSGGAILSVAATGTVTATSSALLAATGKDGGIELAGQVAAGKGTVDLSAGTGGIAQTGGTVVAGTLKSTTGSTGVVALGENGNDVKNLGAFEVKGADLTLVNATELSVVGPVAAANVTLRGNAGTAKAIDVSGGITVTGGTITLAATNKDGGIALSGTLAAGPAGTVDLSASGGGIAQTAGSISAGTLRSATGSTGNVSLTQANAIGTIGKFAVTGGSFALVNAGALEVSGAVDGTGLSLTATTGAISLAATGSLAAGGGTLALTATNAADGGIALGGNASGTTVELAAGSAGITQPGGALAATTLRAIATGGSVALDRAGNTIAILGDSTVTGGALTLSNASAMKIAGVVKADAIAITETGASLSLEAAGSLTTAGGVIALGAANGTIALDGTIDAGAAGVLELSAGGAVTQGGGSITAGTVRGGGALIDVGGALTLAQGGNAIGAIGTLVVKDNASVSSSIPLDISGGFSAADVLVAGTSAGATALSVSGAATATGTMTLVTGAAGGIALSGTLKAATLDLSAGSAGIAQSAGSITAGTLRGSGTKTGAVVLDQAANAIGTLDTFAVEGKAFTLRTGTGLDVTGAVSASDITLRALSGNLSLAASGSLTTPGTALLAAPAGGIVLAGAVDVGILELAAATGVKQGSGAILAGLLRGNGPLAGDVVLMQAGNRIGTVGDIAVVGGTLALDGTLAQTVSGAVKASNVTLQNSAAGTAISVTGSVETAAGGVLLMRAGNGSGGLSLAGTITAGTLDLNAGKGGVAQPLGSITAGTLRSTDGVTGSVVLNKSNAIDTLGTFAAGGAGFSLTNGNALSITGAVSGPAITIVDTGANLTLAGSGSLTTAGTALLSAANGGIVLSGTVKTGTLDLTAGVGGVQQDAGSITAATLLSTGNVGGTLALAQANAIDTVGKLQVTGSATLTTSVAIDVTGALSAADITVNGEAGGANAIRISGSATTPGKMTLTNTAGTGGIALAGTVSAGTLDATTGSAGLIQSAGVVTADTLTAKSTGTIKLEQSANKIGTLGTISASGNFSLVDSISLTVAGTLAAGTISLTSSAADTAITISGNVTAVSDIALAATNNTGGILLSGEVKALTLDVSAGTGGVTQVAGLVSAAELRSASGISGNVAMERPDNVINIIQEFKVSGGDFRLRTAASLGVTGLFADNIQLSTTIGGIGVQAQGLSTSAGGTIRLDSAGGIALVGVLNTGASGTVDLNAATNVDQIASSVITAGTLRSSTGIGIHANFASDNKIGDVGDFKASFGKFTLMNTSPLTVSGVVSAIDIAITGSAPAAKAIDITGTLRTAAGGTIALAATAPGGGIALSGTVDATSTGLIDLQVGAGGITQSAGTITAGTLQSNNGIGGTTVLNAAGNAIGVLGSLKVSAGDLTLVTATPLTIAGPLDVAAGNLSLTSSGAGANALAFIGSTKVAGTARLAASAADGGIRFANDLSAATLDLFAGTGGVIQTGGVLNISTLQATGLNGTVALGGAGNTIGTVADLVTTGGDITLVNATALTVAGPLKASQGSVSITGQAKDAKAIAVTGLVEAGAGKSVTLATPTGGIEIPGQVNAPGGTVTLATALGVASKGSISGGKLVVSATDPAASVTLEGANAVATLAGATLAGGAFTLNNTVGLTISGPVAAPQIHITAAGTMKVLDGVTITVDGVSRIAQKVGGTLSDADINALPLIQLGSYLAVSSTGSPARIETGSITVLPFGGPLATLDFVLPNAVGGGTISFGQLSGKTTDLILVARTGGIVTGTVDVSALLVVGGGGKSDLFGRVGGVDGQAAANKANIAPRPNSDYRFNACPITSVNCVLIPVSTIPPASPLRDVPIIRDRPTQDDADVQLPNVSDEDY